jgi:predicted cupin superfamily sugar epimerase
MHDLNSVIHALDLQPHPEGGFYKEVYRSKTIIRDLVSPKDKSAYTSIYYLLAGKDFSSWHRIKSDETWFFHLGCDVFIYFFDEQHYLQTIVLGMGSKRLQATIPANTWFAARPATENAFCLVSCTVAPGFEFDEFEIAKRDQLLKLFGNSAENIQTIKALTRNE